MSTKATTPFHIWKHNLLTAAGVTADQAKAHAARIDMWFEAGESVQSAADMLVAFCARPVRETKPSSIATRWFRDGRRLA